MFRKLSSALYKATHQQLLSTLKNSNNVSLPSAVKRGGGGIAEKFFRYEWPGKAIVNKKITIVGSQESSLAMALNCLARDLCNQICIMDFHGSKGNTINTNTNFKKPLINNNLHIKATKYFPDTKNSDLIILTKDIKGSKEPVKSFDESLEQYTNVMKNLIPNLLKYSPNTIFLIDTDQADIVTYVAWKLSRLPKNRVLSPSQINEYIKDPSNSKKRETINTSCTADVAAKIIKNYQRILLSTLPPAPSNRSNPANEQNSAQKFTSALCKTIDANLKSNFQNLLHHDFVYDRKIII